MNLTEFIVVKHLIENNTKSIDNNSMVIDIIKIGNIFVPKDDDITISNIRNLLIEGKNIILRYENEGWKFFHLGENTLIFSENQLTDENTEWINICFNDNKLEIEKLNINSQSTYFIYDKKSYVLTEYIPK